MIVRHNKAPAHRSRVCAGALVFLLGCMPLACEGGPQLGGERTLELTGDTIRLGSDVDLHEVTVRTQTTGLDFAPATLQIKAGDVVRFTSKDTRPHGLVFYPPSPEARAAMEAVGQLRSPPLIAENTAWIVSFKGMPAGVYRVTCITHGGTLEITVTL